MCFSVLLVAFLSSSFTNTKTAFDKDVGYSLTIDQNIIEVVPVLFVTEMQISRGVSVPYKGLTFETSNFINEKQISRSNDLAYNLGLRSFSLASITTNKNLNRLHSKQYTDNQGVFRLDIGEYTS